MNQMLRIGTWPRHNTLRYVARSLSHLCCQCTDTNFVSRIITNCIRVDSCKKFVSFRKKKEKPDFKLLVSLSPAFAKATAGRQFPFGLTRNI